MSEVDFNEDLIPAGSVAADGGNFSVTYEGHRFEQLWATDFSLIQTLATDILSAPTPTDSTKIDFPLAKERFKRFLLVHEGRIDPTVDAYCHALWQEANIKWDQINRTAGLSLSEITFQKQMVLQELQGRMGKTLLLSLKDLAWLQTTFTSLSGVALTNALEERFTQEMKDFVQKMRDYYQTQQLIGLQDPKLSYSIRLPKEIAQLLLTEIGYLNLGILPLLPQILFSEGVELLEFQKQILHLLQRLDPKWQPLLDSIQKPLFAAEAADAIRADLDLAPSTLLTDLHAKQSALAALLSEHTQGPVGNCFAVASAIRIHDNAPKTALLHYGELLQNDSLQRTVWGQPARFFFKATLADSDLDQPIEIDAQGKLNQGPAFFWQAPSFAGSLRQMGVDNPTSLFSACLPFLTAPDAQGQIATTPRALLQALASAAGQSIYPYNTAEFLRKGLYGFSTINNRVLRAYETALASMAEAHLTSPIRQRNLASLASALIPLELCIQASVDPDHAFQIRQAFMQALHTRIRYVYNAAVPYATLSADGKSTAGGFELYQTISADDTFMGQHIQTPYDLQRLAFDVWTFQMPQFVPPSISMDPHVQDLMQRVQIYAMDQLFVRNALSFFNPKIAMDPDPLANYDQYDTPMLNRVGNNPYTVMQINEGEQIPLQIQGASFQQAQDLLHWVLSLATWKQQTLRYLEDDVLDEMDPVSSPQHAFNLVLENPDIVAYIKSGVQPADWIQKKLIAPGKLLANSLVSQEMGQAFVQAIVQKLPADFVDPFYQAAATISFQRLNLSQSAQTLLTRLENLFLNTSVTQQQLAQIVDASLLEAIPQTHLLSLQKTAMRFANTNWNQSVKEVYFCVYFNPRTQGLSFATIDEDKTNLSPMNEVDWVNGKQWDTDISR